jgi:hypothetical protein
MNSLNDLIGHEVTVMIAVAGIIVGELQGVLTQREVGNIDGEYYTLITRAGDISINAQSAVFNKELYKNSNKLQVILSHPDIIKELKTRMI